MRVTVTQLRSSAYNEGGTARWATGGPTMGAESTDGHQERVFRVPEEEVCEYRTSDRHCNGKSRGSAESFRRFARHNVTSST